VSGSNHVLLALGVTEVVRAGTVAEAVREVGTVVLNVAEPGRPAS